MTNVTLKNTIHVPDILRGPLITTLMNRNNLMLLSLGNYKKRPKNTNHFQDTLSKYNNNNKESKRKTLQKQIFNASLSDPPAPLYLHLHPNQMIALFYSPNDLFMAFSFQGMTSSSTV